MRLTVKGNPVILKDSSDNPLLNFELKGQTTQITTKGSNILDPTKIDGVVLVPCSIEKGVKYSLLTDGTPSKGGNIKLQYEDETTEWVSIDAGNIKGITSMTAKKVIGYYNLLIDSQNETKHHAVIVGEENPVFEPYTAGKSSPCPEYPQGIENSVVNAITWGNGSDITFSGTLTPIELSKWDRIVKIEGVWKKENNTVSLFFDGNDNEKWKQRTKPFNSFIVTAPKGIFKSKDTSNHDELYSDRYKSIAYCWSNKRNNTISHSIWGEIFIRTDDFNTIDEFKNHLKRNPAKVIYQSIMPTYEVLPEETQDALNRIQTFYPNSVIQTNDGIEVNIEYIADHKLYVDKKHQEQEETINKLTQAILDLGGRI